MLNISYKLIFHGCLYCKDFITSSLEDSYKNIPYFCRLKFNSIHEK
jgi:hypothetical protein